MIRTEILLVILILTIIYFSWKINSLENKSKENFTTTATTQEQINTAVKKIYLADVEAIRLLSNFAIQLSQGGYTVPGNISVNGATYISKSTNEGPDLRFINPLKTGTAINDWTIYNMRGEYGNKLCFWRYAANGTNVGPSLELFDDGKVVVRGDLEVQGNLSVQGNDINRRVVIGAGEIKMIGNGKAHYSITNKDSNFKVSNTSGNDQLNNGWANDCITTTTTGDTIITGRLNTTGSIITDKKLYHRKRVTDNDIMYSVVPTNGVYTTRWTIDAD